MPEVRCELTSDHLGPPVVVVLEAERGERWWWMRWDASLQEVVCLDVCAIVELPDHDDCL